MLLSVIPAQAGILFFQLVVDSRLRGNECAWGLVRVHPIYAASFRGDNLVSDTKIDDSQAQRIARGTLLFVGAVKMQMGGLVTGHHVRNKEEIIELREPQSS